MSGDKPVTVAVDDGYAQTKVWYVGDDGTPHRHVLRTSLRSGRHGLSAMGDDGPTAAYRTEEGEDWTVSEDFVGERTTFDGFHFSPMNRTMIVHALHEAGLGGRDVNLVVGLPVANFFRGDAVNTEAVERKHANLLKGVASVSDDRTPPRIRDVIVGCQAVCAYVDFAFDADMTRRDPDMDGAVAIIDVGGRTTDIAHVMPGGRRVDQSGSGTANLGVLDVYTALEDALRREHDLAPTDRLPFSDLDKVVRERTMKLWGNRVDVGSIVDGAVAEVGTKIGREVERCIGSAATFDRVVFTGGGGALFRSLAESYPNGVVPDDPEFANARGLHLYGSGVVKARDARAAA